MYPSVYTTQCRVTSDIIAVRAFRQQFTIILNVFFFCQFFYMVINNIPVKRDESHLPITMKTEYVFKKIKKKLRFSMTRDYAREHIMVNNISENNMFNNTTKLLCPRPRTSPPRSRIKNIADD